MTTEEEITAFMDSCPLAAALTTVNGALVHANTPYKQQFNIEEYKEGTHVIDALIESNNKPLIKANALYCKYLESIFLKHKKTTIKKELFYYKKYITLRTIVHINKSQHILLLVMKEKTAQ
ncbi:hypothetical protein [Vibrio jasicida]|uniref:hypothetical protein n=1 Tax=Vibrio jasicida TaxID=766224 RepID=UPI00406869BB